MVTDEPTTTAAHPFTPMHDRGHRCAVCDRDRTVHPDQEPATAAAEVEWEQVTYLLAPAYRVVEEDDGWRVFKRVKVTDDGD